MFESRPARLLRPSKVLTTGQLGTSSQQQLHLRGLKSQGRQICRFFLYPAPFWRCLSELHIRSEHIAAGALTGRCKPYRKQKPQVGRYCFEHMLNGLDMRPRQIVQCGR
jgi:hypothetical protein